MRVMHYTMDLTNGEYAVIASPNGAGDLGYWDTAFDCCPDKELAMSPTLDGDGKPYSSWDTIISVLKDQDIRETLPVTFEMEDVDTDFVEHYPEYIRGERPRCRLSAFCVNYDSIHMIYVRDDDELCPTSNTVVIRHPKTAIDLTFTGPKNLLGITPTYRIRIDSNGTHIHENQGITHRQIELMLREGCVPENFKDEDVYAQVIEFTDI